MDCRAPENRHSDLYPRAFMQLPLADIVANEHQTYWYRPPNPTWCRITISILNRLVSSQNTWGLSKAHTHRPKVHRIHTLTTGIILASRTQHMKHFTPGSRARLADNNLPCELKSYNQRTYRLLFISWYRTLFFNNLLISSFNDAKTEKTTPIASTVKYSRPQNHRETSKLINHVPVRLSGESC